MDIIINDFRIDQFVKGANLFLRKIRSGEAAGDGFAQKITDLPFGRVLYLSVDICEYSQEEEQPFWQLRSYESDEVVNDYFFEISASDLEDLITFAEIEKALRRVQEFYRKAA